MNLDEMTTDELQDLAAEIRQRLRQDGRRGRPTSARMRAERRRSYEEPLLAGASLSEIAAMHGVTRQTVENNTPRWMRGLVRQRNAARRRLLAYVTAPEKHQCRTCGAPTTRNRYCSTEHYAMALALRAHLPETSEQHRINCAKTVLRNDGYGRDVWLDHAQRILSGDAPPKNRVWLRPGSAADVAAREAHKNGWPIFDELPGDIRERIEKEAR
jgi:hypothetical protein